MPQNSLPQLGLLEPGWEAAATTLPQNSLAQLLEPGLEAAASVFGPGIGELAGGAFDPSSFCGLDFSATTDLGSFTVSPALALREV